MEEESDLKYYYESEDDDDDEDVDVKEKVAKRQEFFPQLSVV